MTQSTVQPIIAYDIPIEDVVNKFNTDIRKGLSSSEAEKRLKQWGPNQLYEHPPEPWSIKLLRQFKSVVIGVLIIAAVLSGLIGEWIETWAILAIVLINGLLGFFQETKAEKALASLKKLSSPKAKVIRDGVETLIPARNLVSGDLVLIGAGDFIPADARLISSFSLRTQEASLTGESEPVDKDAEHILRSQTLIADQTNMIFAGTTTLSGNATAVITATGMHSELGKIAGLLKQEQREPTPLQKRLTELGHILMILCLVTVAVVAGLQWLRGEELHEVFMFAVSLAVAAVPEGLPAVVTISLAFGLTRMAKRNALIRRLPSVETLGSVTVICSDKTGTLTRNEMTVRKIFSGKNVVDVSGNGCEPIGRFSLNNTAESIDVSTSPDLKQVLTIGAYCNHASLRETEKGWQVLGDPTEGSLIVAARKAKIQADKYPAIFEIPFDANRKMMSVVVKKDESLALQCVKGAPESLLEKCDSVQIDGSIVPLTSELKSKALAEGHEMAKAAMRVLALAYRELPLVNDETKNFTENNLVFSGLVGMIDPPRKEVKDAVIKCQRAGIKPVMITGDHPATGHAIAQELGISRADDPVITGLELTSWNDQKLSEKVNEISVYARVTPEHKLRVVKALKKQGQIVAMTGDGVNDAPAVKIADIGIAMGITGTDVTKEASAMVLTDDNFASIVNAVEEGRGIFANIQNIIQFLLSGNTSEILLVLIAALIGWPTPLIAMQILWINLVTDGLPALALATERPERGIMNHRPRPVNEPIFTWNRGMRILGHGSLLAAVSLFGYWWMLCNGSQYKGNVAGAQAVAFCICAFSQLAYSFSCRSKRFTLPELGLLSNLAMLVAIATSALLQLATIMVNGLQKFFFQEPPDFNSNTWLLIVTLSLIPVSIIEIKKLLVQFIFKRGVN